MVCIPAYLLAQHLCLLGKYTARLEGTDTSGASVLVREWKFEAFPDDTLDPKNGPNGADCNDGVAVDGNEFDRAFTCDCSATKFEGENCEVEAASSSGEQDDTGAIIAGAVAGVVLLVAIFLLVVMKAKLYYAKRKPEDMEALQSAILNELGLGTTYDIGSNELGLTIRFKKLNDGALSTEADTTSTPFEKDLIRVVVRIVKTGSATVHEDTIKVTQQDGEKNVALMIFARPVDGSDDYDSKVTGSLVRSVAKGKLVVKDKVATEVCVRVPKKVPREIDRKNVMRLALLGEGAFGEVFKGQVTEPKLGVPAYLIAAKLVKAEGGNSKDDLLKEAALMAMLEHPNVVRLVGVVTTPRDMPALLLMEYCEHGTLGGFVADKDDRALPMSMRLSFCADTACGLAYLEARRIVHRDVAARNVLLDSALQCKVSDFGMSAVLGSNDGDYAKGF